MLRRQEPPAWAIVPGGQPCACALPFLWRWRQSRARAPRPRVNGKSPRPARGRAAHRRHLHDARRVQHPSSHCWSPLSPPATQSDVEGPAASCTAAAQRHASPCAGGRFRRALACWAGARALGSSAGWRRRRVVCSPFRLENCESKTKSERSPEPLHEDLCLWTHEHAGIQLGRYDNPCSGRFPISRRPRSGSSHRRESDRRRERCTGNG